MSRKNFKADTAQKGQTAQHKGEHMFATKNLNVVEKTNAPSGKLTTEEDRKKRREEREKSFFEFRVAALKRRAKRMKLSEEDTNAAIEKLREQLAQPKQYTILILYPQKMDKMIVEILENNKIKRLMKSDTHAYFEGDATLLAKLREILPAGIKIHPYAKKMESVLPVKKKEEERKKPKGKAERKKMAAAAKKARKNANMSSNKKLAKHCKRHNIAALSKDKRHEFKKHVKALRDSWKAQKSKGATIVSKDKIKATDTKKEASTKLKQAA